MTHHLEYYLGNKWRTRLICGKLRGTFPDLTFCLHLPLSNIATIIVCAASFYRVWPAGKPFVARWTRFSHAAVQFRRCTTDDNDGNGDDNVCTAQWER